MCLLGGSLALPPWPWTRSTDLSSQDTVRPAQGRCSSDPANGGVGEGGACDQEGQEGRLEGAIQAQEKGLRTLWFDVAGCLACEYEGL